MLECWLDWNPEVRQNTLGNTTIHKKQKAIITELFVCHAPTYPTKLPLLICFYSSELPKHFPVTNHKKSITGHQIGKIQLQKTYIPTHTWSLGQGVVKDSTSWRMTATSLSGQFHDPIWYPVSCLAHV